MGYNSVIMICNDVINEIENNLEEFCKRLIDNINRQSHSGGPRSFGIGNCANGLEVVSVTHSDHTSVIAVGGNCSTKLGHYLGYLHHTEEAQIRILKDLAKDRGYYLVKKKEKKKCK